ncbi:VOC family protein [Brevibacterium sp.]|uniref:VOC family protein n=1 Tax=Brevibacterium sp. TaxID=1701 RepID=UPI002812030E|nr:VOC family protein [Brevibacterium sp.]
MPDNARQGQPVWIDYVCHDLETTKNFYTQVFGWDIVDQGPDYGHYHQIMKGQHPVGGFMQAMNMDGSPNPSIPASWTTYLHADDIEVTYTEAVKSGAEAITPPMAVGPHGQMAVIADPAGAGVGLWQPGQFSGFDTPLTPGTPVWFELMTVDFEKATDFYRNVFAWDLVPVPGGMNYSTHGAGESAVAGICDASDWTDTSYWRTYFNVESVDGAAATIRELGGSVLDGPEDTPFGRIATIADPEGARFQLQQNV